MHENPLRTNDEVAEALTSQAYHEITNGFPIKDGNQLAHIWVELLDKGISRMPIIGMADGRVYLLTNPQQNDHLTLLSLLVNDMDIH